MVYNRQKVPQGEKRRNRTSTAPDERPQRARAARIPAAQASTLALCFRKHNVEQVEELRQHFGDQAKLIARAKQGRFQELFARE